MKTHPRTPLLSYTYSQVRVRSSSPGVPSGKDAACLNRIPFPSPPQPNASYEVVGVNQRCLEGQLVPVSGRRGRALIDSPEAQACYVRCSAEGFPVPFHFSVASDGASCWCCGETCTLIRDPGVTVRAYSACAFSQSCPSDALNNIHRSPQSYVAAVAAATQSPTSSPSAFPTAEPTTMAPTQVGTCSA